MMPRSNLHTHTKFCDGKNTAEEMVLAAIAAGGEVLGFSGHSPLKGETWSMKKEDVDSYIAEIERLREKYRDKIEIHLGIEYDTFSSCDRSRFEYVIGSVHFVKKDGVMIPVDAKADILRREIDRCYRGDTYAFARDYFESMYTLYDKTGCDIVGHFDLLTKFNEDGRFFDVSLPKYRDCALDALDALIDKGLIFEINTGAISRGYRKDPYPADFILKRLVEIGARIMLNSDAHSVEGVFCAFDEALEYAKSCGVRELTVLRGSEFVGVKI